MNNKITSISFSIFSNKGVYALLLGSGISRNAGIPTGWDVVIDLINKLAALNKEKCEPNPQEWFEAKYGMEANYSTILSKLAKTPNERLNLLKPYFEPKEEIQLPSKAHTCIAKLIKKGYFKVVITTNFDRLLENAIRAEGVEPTIIRHPEDIKGATPLVHNNFTLIKLNGDYLDNRFLNTIEELSEYNEDIRKYILNIVNEFGIISCGWSGKWDTDLIRVFRECENFRFSNYWLHIGNYEPELSEIALFRKGETCQIRSADIFFDQVTENIYALEELMDNHPLNADIAIAKVKKYIVKDEYKVRLHDLIFQQINYVTENLKVMHNKHTFSDRDVLRLLLTKYESNLEILIPMLVHSVYWSKEDHFYIFEDVLSRLYIPDYSGITFLTGAENFRLFPTLIALYAIGIMAVYQEKYKILVNCFKMKIDQSDSNYSEQVYLIKNVNACYGVISNELMREIFRNNWRTPVSIYLKQLLRIFYKFHIHSDKAFEKSFDIFEYLLSLQYEYYLSDQMVSNFAPYGEYHFKRSNFNNLIKEIDEKADIQQDSWLPIKHGMFDGKYQNYVSSREKLREYLKHVYR